VSFSILSGGLSAENLSISDDPSFNKFPFLTPKSLKIGVELWPLITSKTLNITDLAIGKPEVMLMRNWQGDWNFSTMAVGSSRHPPVAKSGQIAPPEFRVARLKLEKGRVTVGSTVSERKNVYDNVSMESTPFSLKSQFPVMLTANLPGGGAFKADGRVGPIHQADASLSPLDMKVTINGLDLTKSGFADPSAGLAGIGDITNTPVNRDGFQLRAPRDEQLQLVKGAPSVPVNVDFNIDYDLQRTPGRTQSEDLKIGNAVLVSRAHSTGAASRPCLYELDGQNLPARDLQPALSLGVILLKGSSLESGTVSVNLKMRSYRQACDYGNVGLFNAKLAGSTWDRRWRRFPLSGSTSARDISIQKLTTNMRVAPEGIRPPILS
jgi:AsmA protein